MQEDFLFKHSQELSKKYSGKYIAVVDNKLVAVSGSEVEAFQSAKKKYPGKLVSLSYIPRKDELVTLLSSVISATEQSKTFIYPFK